MADNRMFLVHRPTCLAVMLGKRLGWGWYMPPDSGQLQIFYDHLAEHGGHDIDDQDDFILVKEEISDLKADVDWNYDIPVSISGKNGFWMINLKEGGKWERKSRSTSDTTKTK